MQYFLDDPLRVLTVVGGSGGLLYWFKLYRDRTRLEVRFLDKKTWGGPRGEMVVFTIEVTNLGGRPIALRPEISMSGYTLARHRRAAVFHIRGSDRGLPPHQPHTLKAEAAVDEAFEFLWYVVFRLVTTAGSITRVRFRNIDRVVLSLPQFAWELFRFRVLRKVSPRREGPREIDIGNNREAG